MRLSTARATTLVLTLAAAATSFVPQLVDATPPSLITLDAPIAPDALEVADLRASAGDDATRSTTQATRSTVRATVPPTVPVFETPSGSPPESTGGFASGETPRAETPRSPPASTEIPAVIPATAAALTPLLVSTVGDSSMMFLNASLAAALGPERWQPVPTEFAQWTDGTGGFDRHGCGPTGDALRIYFSASAGPLETRFNHPDDGAETCDWRNWIPGGLEIARPDVVVASWGPTSMWGWERDGQMVDLRDPVIRAAVAAAYVEVREAILAAGVDEVIWVAYPPVVWRPYFDTNHEEQPWSRPEVADELFVLLTELGDRVVDLRDLADPANFSDGLHLDDAAAAQAAARIVAALPTQP